MSKAGQAAVPPSRQSHNFLDHLSDEVVAKSRHWWVLLVAGVAWILIAVVILRITYTTVASIAILFGAVCLLMAATEVMVGAMSSSRNWRVAHWLVAALFVVVAVVAFLALKATLVGLAAVMSFFFVLRGAFDVISAIAARREPGWWVLLVVGLTELAIGLWAAGGWKASIVALVAWIAAGTMLHGVGQIASAFLVREIGHDVATRRR